MENLYNLLNEAKSKSIQNKVQIGYTVDGYNDVLYALQQAQASNENSNSEVSSDTRIPIFKRWTTLNTTKKVGNNVSSDGFVVDDVGNAEVYRQQQVRVLGYMPIVVSIPDDKGVYKSHLAYFESKRGTLDQGASIKGKHTFPNVPMTSDNCDSCGISLGSIDNPFEIGIGVDLTDGGTADAFFKKCYSKLSPKNGCAKRLAEKGALLAEVAFPSGGVAQTVHIRVTAEAGKSPKNEIHTIFFPLPLLLTSEYSILGKVQVNTGMVKTVGEDDCKYPFVNSKFYHKESKIDDFTPNYLKDLITNNQVLETKDCVTVTYNSKTFSLGEGRGGCYIRFYCDKDKSDVVQSEFGTIPDEYKEELYKGLGEALISEEVIGYEEVYSGAKGLGGAAAGLKNDSAFYHEGQVDWVKFRQKHPELPAGHEDIIERIAHQFNINTRMWITQIGLETGWFTSKNFKSRRNPGGISAGPNYKGGETYTLDYLGGVRATHAVEVRGEGYGHYWIFETYEDGYRAMAYLLVNSKLYGLAKFGAQTVYEHFTNMYKGGYCDLREAVCQHYNVKLMNQYASVC